MRLITLSVTNYKKFTSQVTIDFSGEITLLVGINGSGKSTVIEALSLIFSDLFLFFIYGAKSRPDFSFEIVYEISVKKGNGEIPHRRSYTGVELYTVKIKTVTSGKTPYYIEINGKELKSQKQIIEYLPDNIICYYAGEFNTLSRIINQIEVEQALKLKRFKNDIREHEVFELFNKNIYFIKDIHFPVLFLTRFLEEENIRLPLGEDVYEFYSISLILERPSLFRGDEKDKYWGFQGYLRMFLEYLEAYSLAKLEITGTGKDERRKLTFNYALHFLTAIQELGIQPVDFDYKFILFNLLNLLNQIGILEDVEIKIIKQGDRITNEFSINGLSEGERQLLLMDAIKRILVESSTLMLLDEPDAYLHPRRQRDLIPHMQSIYSGALYHAIIASHSPFVAQSIPLENIRVFELDHPNPIIPEMSLLSYPAITKEIFNLDSMFSTAIEQKLDLFREYRERILRNEKFDRSDFIKTVKELASEGEETEVIVSREIKQIERLTNQKFDI
jgi:predicted ATPase